MSGGTSAERVARRGGQSGEVAHFPGRPSPAHAASELPGARPPARAEGESGHPESYGRAQTEFGQRNAGTGARRSVARITPHEYHASSRRASEAGAPRVPGIVGVKVEGSIHLLFRGAAPQKRGCSVRAQGRQCMPQTVSCAARSAGAERVAR